MPRISSGNSLRLTQCPDFPSKLTFCGWLPVGVVRRFTLAGRVVPTVCGETFELGELYNMERSARI